MTYSISDRVHSSKSRRWTIFWAGLLLAALALVVVYTSSRAFFSPLALVVVAAIGLAALLLQLRLRQDFAAGKVHSPLWLNVVGIICALAAVLADLSRMSTTLVLFSSLGAVACFGVSGIIVLDALRKRRK